MMEQANPLTPGPSIARTDWLLIAALVALVLPLRLWLLHNTEVTARDSIGYIRYALQFEKKPWAEVWRKNDQHPGYPMAVWLTSLPVRALDGATTPDNMELSTQLVNLVASLLLLAPMYFLGLQLFDRKVAFWATLLYQYLPISAQHLSDGISEPLFLVLLVSGLLQAVHAARERTLARCTMCGLCAGLAYLVRPEGALVLPAFGFVLIALQLRSETRCSWRRFFACGATAVLIAMLIGSIYVIATGRITNKVSANEILRHLAEALGKVVEYLLAIFLPGASQNTGRGHLTLFAVSFQPSDDRALRLGRSVWALLAEIIQGCHYVAAIPALLGFAWSFGSLKRNPGFWVLSVFGLLHSFILIALAMSVNYVSDRHVMILVLIGCYFVVFGLQELPRRVLGWLKLEIGGSWFRSAPVWFAILFVFLIGLCLPKATQRLHGNRVGNHAAGIWLAERLKTGDHVEDDHAWSHFFAGMVFKEGEDFELPKDDMPTCYVVTTRSRDPEIDLKRQAGVLSSDAKVVYVWPEQVEADKARVVVYAQPRVWGRNPWRKSSD